MYIKQSDLFSGVRMDFVKQVMDVTSKDFFEKGHIVFESGDPAVFFYILINGRVALTMGARDKQIYVGSQTGEAFGWAGLVGRQVYPAKAECLDPCTLLQINVREFKYLLDKDITSGFIFYRNLSEALGRRLLSSYHAITRNGTGE